MNLLHLRHPAGVAFAATDHHCDDTHCIHWRIFDFLPFRLNFDQGGFASFILLSGLSVNAALYILNDYNNLGRKCRRANLRLYLSAYNHKITPIILTILSTVLGLLPFVIEGQKEIFWFAFACGRIGGLIFSMVGILIYLPLVMKDLK